MAEETEYETTAPEALAGLVSLAAGVMVPAAVVATWTVRERERAAEWAVAEAGAAAGDTGPHQAEQPDLVSLAMAMAANPAIAQLGLEGWTHHKEKLERGGDPGDWDDQDGRELATVRAAEAAITGLLVLLGPPRQAERSPWQAGALEVLAQHPGGVRAIDLFALLGRAVPSQFALDEWLAAGQSMGLLKQAGHETWALSGAGTGGRS